MFRLALAALLAILLSAAAVTLHIATTVYLLGVVSGLVLGMVMWMKTRPRQ